MSEPQAPYTYIRYPEADEELDDELSTDFRPVCRHEWKWRTSIQNWFEFFCEHCGAVLTKEQVCEILGDMK